MSQSKAGENGRNPVIGFFGMLNHEIRIKIVKLLYEYAELSYSELLQALNISAGKLNFHLRHIKELITLEDGKYRLNRLGILANRLIKDINTEYDYELEKREMLGLDRVTFKLRLLATFIDVIFVALSTGAIFFLYLHLPLFWKFIYNYQFSYLYHELIEDAFLFGNIFLAAWLMFTTMEAYKGETLGKYIVGLRVVKTDGRKLGLADAAVRNVGKVFLPVIDLLLGLKYHKFGHIRFFGYYTKSTVVYKEK